jgi:hypothetical protein
MNLRLIPFLLFFCANINAEVDKDKVYIKISEAILQHDSNIIWITEYFNDGLVYVYKNCETVSVDQYKGNGIARNKDYTEFLIPMKNGVCKIYYIVDKSNPGEKFKIEAINKTFTGFKSKTIKNNDYEFVVYWLSGMEYSDKDNDSDNDLILNSLK